MFRRVFFGLLVTALLVSVVSSATADEHLQQATSYEFLTQEEVRGQVIGHTIKGSHDPWEEKYYPGGKILGKEMGSQYVGKHYFDDEGRWCFKYPNGDGNGCYFVRLEGKTVFLHSTRDTPPVRAYTGKIVR